MIRCGLIEEILASLPTPGFEGEAKGPEARPAHSPSPLPVEIGSGAKTGGGGNARLRLTNEFTHDNSQRHLIIWVFLSGRKGRSGRKGGENGEEFMDEKIVLPFHWPFDSGHDPWDLFSPGKAG